MATEKDVLAISRTIYIGLLEANNIYGIHIHKINALNTLLRKEIILNPSDRENLNLDKSNDRLLTNSRFSRPSNYKTIFTQNKTKNYIRSKM